MERLASQVSTAERESLDLKTERPLHIIDLDSKRTDTGEGSLDMDLDFSLFENKGIAVFCKRKWLGVWGFQLSQIDQPFNKTFLSPTNHCVCLCVVAGS